MRIGYNPHKDKLQSSSDYFHQVIIPVYIPNSEGYFKDSFTILKYCLQSLFKTSHSKTFFTIVNNGCSQEVAQYLNELLQQSKIQEIIHTENIGKLNAILKGLSGHNFKLITITDADVLFANDWQQETYNVFEKFPKAGAVSPTPSSKIYNYYTHNIILDKFFSKSLRFTKVKNPEAMREFAKSIGNPEFYKQSHLSDYLTIENQDCRAVIGAGHFVCTYRNAIFKDRNKNHSPYNLGGDSERLFLDESVVKKRYWRLSTEDNYAFHMGNSIEPWMNTYLNTISEQDKNLTFSVELKNKKTSKLNNWIAEKLLSKILSKQIIRKYFLRFKGLSKEASHNY